MIRDPKNHPRAKRIDLERLRKLRLAGKPNAAIAKALGCSTALVSRLALRMGLPRRTIDASAATAIPTETLATLYQTHGLHELAKLVGASAVYVSKRLRAYGVKLRREGEHIGQDWHQEECATLRALGWSYARIARRLGMTWWKVYRRCRRAGAAIPQNRARSRMRDSESH